MTGRLGKLRLRLAVAAIVAGLFLGPRHAPRPRLILNPEF
jgi:hypothetical protein